MRLFLSGNEAIAFGLVEAGVRFITAYPGTPSSEVLPAAVSIKKRWNLNAYFEWSVNEKVAIEEATAASFANVPSAAIMKQVGLNVGMDPFMNSAIVGTKGGFVLVVADDPGPHSSQTEQDSRFMAFFAKIPVLEPSTPHEAYLFAKEAVSLSRKYEIPVMIRTTTRVSHSREDVEIGDIKNIDLNVRFEKDTDRYAATPHFRFILHKKLNKKIDEIKIEEWEVEEYFNGDCLIITSGISFAYLWDIVEEFDLRDKLKLLRIKMPFPLNEKILQEYVDRFEKVFVVEEGYPLIEMQITDRRKVNGRFNGVVPKEGELTVDVIKSILADAGIIEYEKKDLILPPFKRPSLCPGCGHRSAFYAIKKVFKNRAMYTGDIGCYTLGLNLKAVDTVHCMGASVSFASGFNKAFSLGGNEKTVVATIGDSTFFHSGITPLLDAFHNRVPFILVILDNSTVAMTGNQTTPANDTGADGSNKMPISIESVVKSIGIEFLRVRDAYDIEGMEGDLKDAEDYIKSTRLPAVLIFKHPCVYTKEGLESNVRFEDVYVDTDECTGCMVCVKEFECPSLIYDDSAKKVYIDTTTCIKCGQCVVSCPFNAIKVKQ